MSTVPRPLYLDDDATAAAVCPDCHEYGPAHMAGCPSAPEPEKPRVLTTRGVRRDLARLFPGTALPAGAPIRHREEDR